MQINNRQRIVNNENDCGQVIKIFVVMSNGTVNSFLNILAIFIIFVCILAGIKIIFVSKNETVTNK